MEPLIIVDWHSSWSHDLHTCSHSVHAAAQRLLSALITDTSSVVCTCTCTSLVHISVGLLLGIYSLETLLKAIIDQFI